MRALLLIILSFLLLFIIIDNNCRCNIDTFNISTQPTPSTPAPKIKLKEVVKPKDLHNRIINAFNGSGNGIMISMLYGHDIGDFTNTVPTLDGSASILRNDKAWTLLSGHIINLGYIWDPLDNLLTAKCTYAKDGDTMNRVNKKSKDKDRCGKLKGGVDPILCNPPSNCILEMLKDDHPTGGSVNEVVIFRQSPINKPYTQKPIPLKDMDQYITKKPSALVILYLGPAPHGSYPTPTLSQICKGYNTKAYKDWIGGMNMIHNTFAPDTHVLLIQASPYDSITGPILKNFVRVDQLNLLLCPKSGGSECWNQLKTVCDRSTMTSASCTECIGKNQKIAQQHCYGNDTVIYCKQ